MALPGPGPSLSVDEIATEFGGTTPHSLTEYYRGGGLVPNTPTNLAIPTSGQIAVGDFYGSTNRPQIALTISANTYNYDIYTQATPSPAYVAGVSDITVTVDSGVIVGSTTTPTYAMLVPSAFDAGDTVTIINNGVIQGMGGNGGAGGRGSPSLPLNTPGLPGAAGGNAIYVNRPTVITNNGTVASGGGGGGGGGSSRPVTPRPPKVGPPIVYSYGGGGGGGGAGYDGGTGGAGGLGGTAPGNPGSVGTSPAGGAGGPSPGAGVGGAGGGRGAAGAAGANSRLPGGAGGATGNYIVGNPFVTWPVIGTRQGGVA